ncbi:TPA: hypothetical protein ACH3X2_000889 [Trebouxia sp. C0005]
MASPDLGGMYPAVIAPIKTFIERVIWHTLAQEQKEWSHNNVILFCSIWHVIHNQIELPDISVQSLSLSVQLPKPFLGLFGRELCFCQPILKNGAVRRPCGRSHSFLNFGRCWCLRW